MQTVTLRDTYLSKKSEIENRLNDFRRIWKGAEEKEAFAELIFCLLTPQSKARTCWAAVSDMQAKGMLFRGRLNQVRSSIRNVRFKNKKAEYIKGTRYLFSNNGSTNVIGRLKGFDDAYSARDWLVKNVKGYGFKEASHFLRNIGFGLELAILDRHILKNLDKLGVIDEVPASMTQRKYLDIEKKMERFARRIQIPMPHLDLLLWYHETGEVFK